jgi:hypothetical protein
MSWYMIRRDTKLVCLPQINMLHSFLNFSGTDAACANIFANYTFPFNHANFLNIWLPHGVGLSVRVAHIVTKLNSFAAYITLGHNFLQFEKYVDSFLIKQLNCNNFI